MNKKKKELQEKINKIICEIDINVKNLQLYNYIMYTFYSVLNQKKISVLERTNGICLINKSNQDLFEIKFEPSLKKFNKIIIKHLCCEGRCDVIKQIEYNDDAIIVREEQTEKILCNKTKEINCILKKGMERTYINNTLTYQYKFDSTINFFKDKCLLNHSEEDMYISNKKAIRRSYIVKDNIDKKIESHFYYDKTDFCDEQDFNTRENFKKCYCYSMQQTTEEEYNKFISNEKIKDKLNKVYLKK